METRPRVPWPFTLVSLIAVAVLMAVGVVLARASTQEAVLPQGTPAFQVITPEVGAATPVGWVPRCYRRLRGARQAAGAAPPCLRAPNAPYHPWAGRPGVPRRYHPGLPTPTSPPAAWPGAPRPW